MKFLEIGWRVALILIAVFLFAITLRLNTIFDKNLKTDIAKVVEIERQLQSDQWTEFIQNQPNKWRQWVTANLSVLIQEKQ